jgi:hypothetical protein
MGDLIVKAAKGRDGIARRCVAAVVVGMVAALAGCASSPVPMRADVTAFHQWQAAEPLSYAFRRTADQQQSLEHRSYETLVAQQLASLGFSEAPPASARYQVALRPSTSMRREQRIEHPFHPAPYPGWGPGFWGPGHGIWAPYGPYGWPGYWGPSRFGYGPDPWLWGPPVVREIDWATHMLRVDVYDMRSDGQKVYEGSANTTGMRLSLPEAMPVLVSALFSDFPGPSGQPRRVDVDTGGVAPAR